MTSCQMWKKREIRKDEKWKYIDWALRISGKGIQVWSCRWCEVMDGEAQQVRSMMGVKSE